MTKKNSTNKLEQQISQAINKNQVPILTLDSRWHTLFPEEKKTANIKRLEGQVNELLKKQGKLIQEAKHLKKLKRNFMQKIVNNMEESNSEKSEMKRIKKLESSQRYIKEINEKLKVYDNELEAIPREIRQVNGELLKASFEICYAELKQNKKIIHEMDQWINETRQALKDKIIAKQELVENNTNIYSYMHDILGAEMMEVFDQKNL